jgi:1-deoxy-D-xylulose-5-phosphate synthase
MLRLALKHPGPIAMRYPKANLESVARPKTPVEVGKAEIYEWGADGGFIAYGTLFCEAVKAAARLKQEKGFDLTVINARFAKPLDREVILKAVRELPWVITVEENTLEGGFGSAVLEAANAAGLDCSHILRLGIPDRFIEHAERHELLADLGLDSAGLVRAATQLTSAARQYPFRRLFGAENVLS